MTTTRTAADRRARVASWTTDVWKAHFPRETDPVWIAAWLIREKRKRVRRLMQERLKEMVP